MAGLYIARTSWPDIDGFGLGVRLPQSVTSRGVRLGLEKFGVAIIYAPLALQETPVNGVAHCLSPCGKSFKVARLADQ